MVRLSSKKRALLLLLGLLTPRELFAADFRFVPSIGIIEDVTDNIYETASSRRSEIVTRVQPGGVLKWSTSWAAVEGVYNLDYRYHAFNTYQDGINHTIGLQSTFTLIPDFFKVDLTDTFKRISLDVARDTTSENLSVAQTDQNVFSVSPYLLWRLGQKGVLRTGIRYDDIRYWTEAGIDRREEGAFALLTHELTPRLSLTAGYAFTRTHTDPLRYDDHDVSIGMRYEYAANSFIFGSVGNSWQNFSNGSRMSNLFWDAGIINDFGGLVATLETQVRYSEDPLTVSLRQKSHSVKLEKVMPRGTLGVSAVYSEYVDTFTGASSRYSTTISAGGSRELTSRLTCSLNVAGDELSRRSSLDYPYHLSATATLGYTMARETSLGFTYTYATYRYGIENAKGSVEVNRAVVQLRKSF